MVVTETSLESYEKVLPRIGERQSQVLDLMKDLKPRTDAMITRALGLKINQITNRRGELVKKGCIRESHKDTCVVTGGRATYWIITQCGKEVNNFRNREDIKFGIE